MKDVLCNSTYFGVMISIMAYVGALALKRRLGWAVLNPLLVSIVLVVGLLLLIGVDYDSYNAGAQYLSYLLTPATVCLAIPLYEQLSLLRSNWKAIMSGIVSGVITSMACIFVFAKMFMFSHEEYIALLPKSITTAIGMSLSEEMGGIVTLTVITIVITGVFGNVVAEGVLKFFRITDPIAKGIAIGSAAHAIGTSKAMEMGRVEGAMSSLSIAVAGLTTVLFISVFAELI